MLLELAMYMQDSDTDSDSDVSTADEVAVTLRNHDGTVSSAGQHELQIAADLAAQPAWFGGGRFGGRAGKLARIRQQEALAGGQAGLLLSKAEPSPATVRLSKKRKTPSSNCETADLPAESTTSMVSANKAKASSKHKQKRGCAEKKAHSSTEILPAATEPVLASQRSRVVVEPVFVATTPKNAFVQTPSSGWWGARKFMSAGCLEGMDQGQNRDQAERRQFDEDDQTNLYMAAQNLKTSGKKGLGINSHIGQFYKVRPLFYCKKHKPAAPRQTGGCGRHGVWQTALLQAQCHACLHLLCSVML